MNEAAEVLKVARGMVASGRWIKNTAHSVDGQSHCALGAVWEAQRQLHLFDTNADFILDRIATQFVGPEDKCGMRPAAAYNDAEKTTAADIVALFDKALADLGAL